MRGTVESTEEEVDCWISSIEIVHNDLVKSTMAVCGDG